MRNHFLFSSDKFDQSSEMDNPQTDYGEDLAVYLIRKLKNENVETDPQPLQEDWGWMIFFTHQGKNYELGLGSYEDEGIENGWLCFLETCRKGIWNRFFGKKPEIVFETLHLIDRILREDKEISNIRWYYEDDWMNGEIEKYTSRPNDQITGVGKA